MTEPIKPSDVILIKPDQVFEAFNELIAQNWDGHRAEIKSEDVARKISMLMDIHISDVYEKKYLDAEEAYRQEEWHVIYDEPDYNERPYDPFFVFLEQV